MASSSAPVIARSPGSMMPSAFAIAEAVTTWSPVIMTGLMPALRQVATAALASGRGGSIMPTRPSSVRPSSSSSEVGLDDDVKDKQLFRGAVPLVADLVHMLFLLYWAVLSGVSRLPEIPLRAFLTWKVKKIAVKVTAMKSATGSAI